MTREAKFDAIYELVNKNWLSTPTRAEVTNFIISNFDAIAEILDETEEDSCPSSSERTPPEHLDPIFSANTYRNALRHEMLQHSKAIEILHVCREYLSSAGADLEPRSPQMADLSYLASQIDSHIEMG